MSDATMLTEQIVDVFIVGAGPAGLQAAVHAARKKAVVVVAGKTERSSLHGAHVENYLCVEGITEGGILLKTALAQARRFGASVIAEDVLHISQQDDLFDVTVESGAHIKTRSLVLATGTSRKKLKVKGEKELAGRGVSYCVDCDANFFRGARVAVVGNESAAVDGALTLTRYASQVFLIAKKLEVSAGLREKLALSKVEFREGVWVREIVGENAVTGLMLDDDSLLSADGVFIELGAKGAINLATSLGVMLDSETCTFIDTNKRQETNIPGVYAAGDIAGQPWQMAKAVGEGCVAGWESANYAKKRRE